MQFRKSVEYYEDALKDTDEHEELIIKLARIHFLLNKPGKALAYLNSFPADFFFDDTILPDLVKLFYDHGFAKKAIAFLQKIIDNDPYNYSAWYFLGFTYQKLEDFSKAVTAFEYAIAIDDDNTMGYLGKGNALMDLGKYKEAIEFLYQAFDNDITDAEILCNIAECYENLDELSRARYYYAKALKLDNNLSDAYYGLAVIAKKKEEYSDAVNSLHSAIDKDPFESLYHVELAELYLLLNEHDKAIYHYLKGLEIDPDTIEIVLDVSQAYLENDQSELSIGLLKNQLERFSEDHRLLYRISSYLFQSGNYQDGYEYLHLALQKKPEEYHLLYEYAPFLESNETITNIIDLYHS
jgi:tetratricopeptide (TPR) repeat protein